MAGRPRHIDRAGDLRDLCAEIAERGSFAVDMEFESERTYFPKLQLIQVAAGDDVALIDPLELDDLAPFWSLITDPGVTKITHAGRQDADIMYNECGEAPAALVDTQIAAALLGMGEQIGYASLVSRLLGIRLRKTERVTDWSIRPLSPQQIEYAVDDVIHLRCVHDKLMKKLGAMGRLSWFEEEVGFYADPDFYGRDPETAYLRVGGKKGLNRRGMGILRELARWREEEAARRNEPRGRVVSDDVLVEIAARKPKTVDDLRPLRRLHRRELERSGNALVKAVAAGEALPEDRLPSPSRGLPEDPSLTLVAHLLDVMVRMRACQHQIAPSYLSNQKGIRNLVDYLAGRINGDATPRILEGWRRELVGDDLVELFEGKLALAVNPKRKQPVCFATNGRADGDGS